MPELEGQEVSESATPLPEYDNPPVNEVVCGVHFASIDTLLVPHFGLLWERFKAEYPTCEETPPLLPVVESFTARQDRKPEFVDLPPLPRIWFVHKSGNGIIQVQRDRFLHNWRRLQKADKYPRYEKVFTMFSERLAAFRAFVEEEKLGPVEPLQYEMTYVNHIFQGEGWNTTCDAGQVFPDFAWKKQSRFLPCPEAINLRTAFLLPDNIGRLHVTIRNGESNETRQPLYLLDLTVRGIGHDRSLEGMKTWFNTAREWIVRGFTDLTDSGMQQDVWRRTR